MMEDSTASPAKMLLEDYNKSPTTNRASLTNSSSVQPVPNLPETMCVLNMMSSDGPLAKLSKDKPLLSGISIPGISNIFGTAHLSRRIVWTVVVITTITIATIQVTKLHSRKT